MLAWARISILTTIHACNCQAFETKQHLPLFQATTTTHKHHKHETKLKIGRYEENTKTLAFLTLTKATMRGLQALAEGTAAPRTPKNWRETHYKL